MSLDIHTPNFVPHTPRVRVLGDGSAVSGAHVPSTVASWSVLLAQAIESAGVDAHAVFAEAGLDLDEAKDPDTRFPVERMTCAWELAVARCEDPCLPLRLTQYFKPQNISAIGIAMSLSTTLMDALHRCVQYARIATEGAVLSLHEQGETVVLRVDVPIALRPIASGYSIEAFMASLIELFRQMAGPGFAPLNVEFAFPRRQGCLEFERYFGCPVHFTATATQLTFGRAQLQVTRTLAIDSLARVLDAWMAEYLVQLDLQSLSGQLRIFLIEQMAHGDISLADASRHLCISERSLQRKLAEEAQTFAHIKDDCRRHLAEKLVHEHRLSLAEIAFVLGFADQSAFTRCFKRWTGTSPRRFVPRNVSVQQFQPV